MQIRFSTAFLVIVIVSVGAAALRAEAASEHARHTTTQGR